jgi:hypothetical protein
MMGKAVLTRDLAVMAMDVEKEVSVWLMLRKLLLGRLG